MVIYLIRHGETQDNKRRVLQMPDSVLSENGEQQAQKLAERLDDLNVGQILSSDYVRTKQTANVLNTKHGAPVSFEPLLRERHFGDWRGKHYDDVAKDKINEDLSPPNGEDKAAFFERVSKAWDAIKQQASTSDLATLVVSHGLFCRALVQNHLSLKDGLVIPDSWINTSVTVIEYTNAWTATTLNCAKHLSEDDLWLANNAAAV